MIICYFVFFCVEINKINTSKRRMEEVKDKVEWSSVYEVGEQKIDEQHKNLFGAINQLADLIKLYEKNQSDQFSNVIRLLLFMKDYVHVHFRDEETAMAKNNYSGLEHHKVLHAKFTAYITKFYLDYLNNKEGDLRELLLNLKEWLSNHILGEDMKAFNQNTK